MGKGHRDGRREVEGPWGWEWDSEGLGAEAKVIEQHSSWVGVGRVSRGGDL